MSKAPTAYKRVFCIGMNKTGTSTMKQCFEFLGLTPVAAPTNCGPNARQLRHQFFKDRDYEPLLKLAENYRSFEDRPWNMWEMYRHLDMRFPDSLFILTAREPESWWRSTEQWITVSKPDVMSLYQLHLRVSDPGKDSMVASYLRYNTEVTRYFEGTGKLLRFDLAAGDGWEKLCLFLGLAVPDRDFPHANRQSYDTEDERATERKRLMRNGVLCQACAHVTPVNNLPIRVGHNAAASTATGRIRALAKARARKLRRKMKEGSRSLLVSAATRMFYDLHRISCVVSKRNSPRNSRIPRLADNPRDDRELAVVACFFNPSGSQRRVANFQAFQASIQASGVHCLFVELALCARPFQLEDGDNVIRLRSQSVMWHKERLLNIGIRQLLAEGYKKIAWLDGDIIFTCPDWPARVATELDAVNLCQVFGTVAIAGENNRSPMIGTSAIKYFLEKGAFFLQSPRNLAGLLAGRLRGGQSGFGWAARAEVLQKALLFDRAIVGGGDKLILGASLCDDFSDPRFEALTHSSIACELCGHRNRSVAYVQSFLDWAVKWHGAVDGRVGYVDLHIEDMYHGKRSDRKYLLRRDILFRHDFDPARDLAEDDAGCLAWGSEKSALHQDVESYFLSRREDV